jgi:hypothetical protein
MTLPTPLPTLPTPLPTGFQPPFQPPFRRLPTPLPTGCVPTPLPTGCVPTPLIPPSGAKRARLGSRSAVRGLGQPSHTGRDAVTCGGVTASKPRAPEGSR